jgi:hypothetical protein
MSMPEETPAAVMTLPFSTTRSSVGIAPKRVSWSRASQCVLALSPRRMPASRRLIVRGRAYRRY